MAEWQIELKRRGTTDDGRPLYACIVRILPVPTECEGGTCGHHSPAYSHEEAVETVRDILDNIRDGLWKRPEKPLPEPANTKFIDHTGEFVMGDFFDGGTLEAFMAGEA